MNFPYVRRDVHEAAITAKNEVIARYSASNERWALSNLELEKQVGILKNRVAALNLSNQGLESGTRILNSILINKDALLEAANAEIQSLKDTKCSRTNSKPKKKS